NSPGRASGARGGGDARLSRRLRRLRPIDRALHLRHAAGGDRDPLEPAAPGDRPRRRLRHAPDRSLRCGFPRFRTRGVVTTAPVSFGRLWALMLTVFVDMVGFLMILPLLPFYAEGLGAPPSLIGLMVSAYAVAQLA